VDHGFAAGPTTRFGGWIIELDRNGKILGQIEVADEPSLHTVTDMGDGQPMTVVGNRVIWFKRWVGSRESEPREQS
jgi:hypothetical protein